MGERLVLNGDRKVGRRLVGDPLVVFVESRRRFLSPKHVGVFFLLGGDVVHLIVWVE